MCGIAGLIDIRKDKSAEDLQSMTKAMTDALAHRGPDNDGFWVDQETGVALGHRRLAIIDLSEAGRQPMQSSSGRYIINYNGEFYNFLSVKKELEEKGVQFSGGSDTEVFLEAVERWGLEEALKKINGMFAFALWDKKTQTLNLARDRMGKKPLYYGWVGKTFMFTSELKALHTHPDFVPEVDRNALAIYTRHNYVPVPWSIYKGIYKLPQASYMAVPLDKDKPLKPQKYWDINEVAQEGSSAPFTGSFDEALKELDEILGTAVSERMISDVPLGAFLSGGIDSSLITAIMQKNSSKPIKTFCIGFEESGYNEAPHAKKIAGHLGTDHTEYFVTAEEARNVIPGMPKIFDEPFADPSQIPTYHVSRLARQNVTVALSGDGGDEGFAGYQRYHKAIMAVNTINKIPGPLRKTLAQILRPVPLGKAQKALKFLEGVDENEFYRHILSYWQDPNELVIGGQEPKAAMNDFVDLPNIDSFMNRMMYMDMAAYLPDDILVKVDRASMATSLETRAPLLDYKVIEYAWRTPLSMKVDNNGGKLLLRTLLEQYMPKALFDRPKQGFGIPHGDWIKGPLKDWAASLLDESRLRSEGFFNADMVTQKWQEHISGQKNWDYALWGLLMFQAWNEYYGRSK